MNKINNAVTIFSLEEDGGRMAEYARIISVVSIGLLLAIGSAIGSTLHCRFVTLLDELATGV